MPPLLFGLLTVSFGLSAETGGQIQSFESKATREKAVVKNSTGENVAQCNFNPTEECTLEIIPTSTTSGVGAASPGVALTSANFSTAGGILIVDEVTTNRSSNDYKKLTVKASASPLITS